MPPEDGFTAGFSANQRFIATVGLPSAGLAFMIWWVTWVQGAKLDAMQAAIGEHKKDTAAIVEHLKEDSNQQWASLGVLQRICVRVSKTDSEKMECLALVGKGK